MDDLLTRPLGFLTRLVRSDQPESTHRYIAIGSAISLWLATIIVSLGVYWQAVLDHDVSTQLVVALSALVTALTSLAAATYLAVKKQEPNQ